MPVAAEYWRFLLPVDLRPDCSIQLHRVGSLFDGLPHQFDGGIQSGEKLVLISSLADEHVNTGNDAAIRALGILDQKGVLGIVHGVEHSQILAHGRCVVG